MKIRSLLLFTMIVAIGLMSNTNVFAQSAPVVDSTSSAVSITRTTAVCGGYVGSTGGSTLTDRGVVYNTTGTPTISDSVVASFKVTDANSYEPSYLTSLKPNTKYYVRAYATNSVGTSYGNEITFTTSAGNAEASWPLLSDFAGTTVGNISVSDFDTSHCPSNVSFNQGPKNNFSWDGDGWLKIPTRSQMTDTMNGNFYLQFSVSPASGKNLSVEGISFGALGYKTHSIKLAVYYSLNGFASDSSALGPAMVADSVHSVLDATVDNPISLLSANESITTPMGREWESYSPNITVPDGQALTVRIYVWGKNGGTLGIKNPVVTGTTSPTSSASLPVVDSTSSVVSITRTTAVCGGYVGSTGDSTLTDRGVVYNTTGTPTLSDSVAASFKVTDAVSYEPSYLTGLLPNTKYYVRAYATTSVGTSYGNEITFTTSSGNAEASWPLLSDFVGTTVGNISVSDFDTSHCPSNVSFNQGPKNNFSWDGDGWLKIPTRSQMTDTMNGNFYLQFSVSPASGKNLSVEGISFGALGYKTHSIKLAVYYSLNGFASDSSALGPAMVADSVHSVLDATVDNPISLLSANESITTPMGREWESYSPNITVPDGQALTVRIYVWGKNGGTVGIKNPVITGTTSAVLPVEMTSFTGLLNNGIVSLKWQTATENNNKGFEVQRKTGAQWEKIGFVNGKGTSTKINRYSFSDNVSKLDKSGNIFYRLCQVDYNGTTTLSKEVSVSYSSVPKTYSLSQNYPNPFNPSTTIQYALPFDSHVIISIYNINGQLVRTLLNGTEKAGKHDIMFNTAGKNLELSSGIYFYSIEANAIDGSDNFRQTKKMILLK